MDFFFAHSPDLFCIASLDGPFIRINPPWTSCLEWSLEQLKARPFLEFVHPRDRAATRAKLASHRAGAAPTVFENRFRHRDGSYRWLQWKVRTLPGRRQFCAMVRDVTEQKRLERAMVTAGGVSKKRLAWQPRAGSYGDLSGAAAVGATSRKSLAPSAHPDPSLAAKVARLLDEAFLQASIPALVLAPTGRPGAGLDGALETLAHRVRRLFRISCFFQCRGRAPHLRRQVEHHLFRIAQEAVENAVTHGRADRIEISLSCREGDGYLKVRDHGAGMDHEASRSDGAGLHTMGYRARLIGAALKVRSRSGLGTTLTCRFPLAPPPPPARNPDPKRGKPGSGHRSKKKIVVVDDHPLVRRGLRALIEAEPDLAVCSEASSRRSALHAIIVSRPDLIIVDLALDDGDGLDLLKDLKALYPKIPTLVLSMHDESVYAERSLRVGAWGYVAKQEPAETLLAAIRRLLAGKRFMSGKLKARLAAKYVEGRSSKTPSGIEALSNRELQVFRLIGEGRGTRQIAGILQLSVKTIESHREHIKHKLTLSSAPELTQRAAHWVASGGGLAFSAPVPFPMSFPEATHPGRADSVAARWQDTHTDVP